MATSAFTSLPLAKPNRTAVTICPPAPCFLYFVTLPRITASTPSMRHSSPAGSRAAALSVTPAF